ncbi:hypothetical protein TNCV_4249571 [Trichonephila clavipes]|nr:hypothetical protein TNCV_4249571 [Trichonephila clavipes]
MRKLRYVIPHEPGASFPLYVDENMSREPCDTTLHMHSDKILKLIEGFNVETATAGSDVVQSGRPIFDDFFQHLWPAITRRMLSSKWSSVCGLSA